MVELTSTALLLAIFGFLIAASVLSGRTLERLGVPVVLLFLLLGILAGSEGLGGVSFDDYGFAFRVGTAALVLILLDGGLNTSVASVKESFKPAAILATFGVAGTAGLVALFARFMGLPWTESMLLGAVVSSTDAAVVFAVLRGGGLRLHKRIATTIELESGINDPMAVILTLAVTTVVAGEQVDRTDLITGVPLQLAIGLAAGVGFGYAARWLLRRVRLSTAGFYPVLIMGGAFLCYGVTTLIGGSGFLAVYAAAVVIGNSRIPLQSGLARVLDAIAWLSQITMFLMFGLLVFPSQLMSVAWVGIAIALFMAFVARPLVVTLCLLPFRYPAKEVAYVGWVGLKGAVPIILAIFPVLAGVQGAMNVFNIVFFIVVCSAIVPGATLRWVTRRLGLQAPDVPSPVAALEINSTRLLNGELLSFFITEPLAVCNVPVSKIPFPPHCSAVLLVRGEELIAPRGSTVLRPGDHVYVFCRAEDKPFIQLIFGRPEEHT
ncbi:MAG TPA: potassium/proton antiporter [Phycisphaerae bacterium]|nr:potassium/proton antiporter [Phycisphaerae bacterium]HOJ76237.1 potassium/proton antiporter [Phycisphaerae bacterium]HOM53551.1 potassium/proton antiporter [Phycisphaerae bacterium]HOQ86929.1 potassium/proton antiporter [Phycisphaerae bacterium]HPP28861.1 potassium/proton antiporter [Phycisphaerae bacterium]